MPICSHLPHFSRAELSPQLVHVTTSASTTFLFTGFWLVSAKWSPWTCATTSFLISRAFALSEAFSANLLSLASSLLSFACSCSACLLRRAAAFSATRFNLSRSSSSGSLPLRAATFSATRLSLISSASSTVRRRAAMRSATRCWRAASFSSCRCFLALRASSPWTAKVMSPSSSAASLHNMEYPSNAFSTSARPRCCTFATASRRARTADADGSPGLDGASPEPLAASCVSISVRKTASNLLIRFPARSFSARSPATTPLAEGNSGSAPATNNSATTSTRPPAVAAMSGVRRVAPPICASNVLGSARSFSRCRTSWTSPSQAARAKPGT
mmetsp:Transcript_140936/g.351414  ORF Transcript_140936/g.351414 Transcript_140936/m.351414 type:complete len:330 (-) Transcript_140936:291-1280(-)